MARIETQRVGVRDLLLVAVTVCLTCGLMRYFEGGVLMASTTRPAEEKVRAVEEVTNDVLKVRELQVVDHEGRVRAIFGFEHITFLEQAGDVAVLPSLRFMGWDGKPQLRLGFEQSMGGDAVIELADIKGEVRSTISVNSSGHFSINTVNKDSKVYSEWKTTDTAAQFSMQSDKTMVELSTGKYSSFFMKQFDTGRRIYMAVNPEGPPTVTVCDEEGKIIPIQSESE